MQRPAVMGIVNVTPDSFSDGGVHVDPEVAAAAARRMVEEGAAIVDVGGESTRPGSEGVSLDEELRRVVPVLERLEGVPVSIDTAKSEVARRALELGAELVNDVTALRGDPELAGVVADAGAYLCLMHMQGEPRTMQVDPRYDDVAGEVAAFLEERLAFAVAAGIPEEHVCLDPGIGFGKTPAAELRAAAAARRPGSRSAGPCSSASRARARSGSSSTRRRDRLARRVARRGRRRLRARRVDLPRPRRPRARRGADRGGGGMRIELAGIALRGFHGVLDGSARDGQRSSSTSRSRREEPREDDIDATVDYRDVVACVREVSDGHAFQLLETLAAAVADELLRRFPVSAVRVRVGKPELELEGGRGHRHRRAVTRAYVGVGANLGDREATIRAALAALPGVVAVSELRETEPVGVVDQPRS